MTGKKVVLLNIDSLIPELLDLAIQTGHTPALKFLTERGHYVKEMVSAFPTMSVTIDTSLLTGTYADEHQIPALNWFDVNTNEIINYGTGPTETYKIGWKKTIYNMLYRLNNSHMSKNVKTIFETLAEHGHYSASINSFIYRGNHLQQLKMPTLFKKLTYFKDGKWKTKAPAILSLGTLSKIRPWGFTLQTAAGNYKFMARELRYLIRKNLLPSFTFCIFQDLDLRMHFKGPIDLKGIAKIDKEIQKILDLFPSWDDALNDIVWIVIGDNGHSPMHHKRKEALIDLRQLLKKYRITKLTKPVRKKDEIVITVNQRMAYIYILNDEITDESVINNLKRDKRIDLLAWKNNHFINVQSNKHNGKIQFKRGGNFEDMYGQKWSINGNYNILNLTITDDNKISYNDYPDALARLQSALNSHDGRYLIITAKPGHEFKAKATSVHPGAAHGSLHKQESLVPLIIAGIDKTPKHSRIIDLKAFIENIILHE